MNSKMKITILMVLGTLVSARSFAALTLPTAAASWDAIRASTQVSIQQTALANTFGADGFFNACVAGNMLQSITPLKACVETKYESSGDLDGGVHAVCVRYEEKTAQLPVDAILSTTPTFRVFGNEWVFNGPDGGGMNDKPNPVLFTKTFMIPACK
jgi:hypothetical protein